MTQERGNYTVEGRTEVRRETRLPYADPRYVAPTIPEFREVARMVGSGSQCAAIVGMDGRKFREYIAGTKGIPYSAWRLLLIEAGLAIGDGIDHESLLRKYIAWIGECEGVNYVDSGTYHHREESFTDEEWAELERLAARRSMP